MTSWQTNSTKTTKWGNWKQTDEIDYWPLLSSCAPGHLTIILQCNNTTLPEKILQNDWSSWTYQYLTWYIRIFLPLLIIGSSASNNTISLSTYYRNSNLREILFFTQSGMSTGLHITILNPSNGTTLLSKIDNIDVLR